MEQLEKIAYIVLGWLLGLLAPAIVERIRRAYRTADLQAAVFIELHEHQFVMALASYKLRDYTAQLTDDYLNWLAPILANYTRRGTRQSDWRHNAADAQGVTVCKTV